MILRHEIIDDKQDIINKLYLMKGTFFFALLAISLALRCRKSGKSNYSNIDFQEEEELVYEVEPIVYEEIRENPMSLVTIAVKNPGLAKSILINEPGFLIELYRKDYRIIDRLLKKAPELTKLIYKEAENLDEEFYEEDESEEDSY